MDIGDEIRLSKQRGKAWKLLKALKYYRPDLTTTEQRRAALLVFTDDKWNWLRLLAEVRATDDPGKCEVSETVKMMVFENLGLGEAVQYGDRDQDAFNQGGNR